jgi:hypothetical protein
MKKQRQRFVLRVFNEHGEIKGIFDDETELDLFLTSILEGKCSPEAGTFYHSIMRYPYRGGK